MIDWIIGLYRKLNNAARRAMIILLSATIVFTTLHLMTFPATAMSRSTGEGEPGFVLGTEENQQPVDNVSEGETPEVLPVETVPENTEETSLEPAPADTDVTSQEPEVPETTPEPKEEVPAENTTEPTPEVTPTPTPEVTPTPTPEAEEEEEESDPEADVEDAQDWEEMFRDIELTGVWADDLITLAETQIGYTESEKNFVKDDEDNKHGYTRYGAWYGDPYKEEWDSLFVMFNLYYAGITKLDIPYETDCEEWLNALKEAGLFFDGSEYEASKGDLVFADTDEDGSADHVAIIKAVEHDEAGNPDKLTVIEGDADDEVKENTYEYYSPMIVGFGKLPENPLLVQEEAEPVILSFTESTKDVEVTVLYEEGAFPEGTAMTVVPVTDKDIIAAINDTVTDKEVVKVQAVDIKFTTTDGKEIEPIKPIKVTMKSRSVPKEAEETPAVVHVDDQMNTSVVEAVQAEEAEKPTEAVTFESDAFSVYAIVYTVDFAYSLDGNVYSYSMDGGKSMKLSALAEVLGIIEETSLENGKAFVAEVQNVKFSDPSLVRVRKDFFGNDWTLTSLKPFDTDEALTITMKNGNVFTVDVTDDNPYSPDLANFILTVDINADKEDGKYVIKPGKTYTAHIVFKEDPDGMQFDESGHLEYQLPDGFDPAAAEGTFTIIAKSKGVEYPVEGNRYKVEGGKLIVDLNKESPNYKYVSSSGITTLNMNIEGMFDTSKSSINWNGEIKTDIKPDLDTGVSIEKSITSFNKETGVITYQMKVKSLNGENTNIVVSDRMNGTAVVINQDVAISGASISSDGITYTTLDYGDRHVNGFDFTIPSMAAGAEATITYTATINKEAFINNSINLDWDGQNSVTATPDDPGKPDRDFVDLKNIITKPSISKSADVSDVVNGKRTLTWTITATSTDYLSLAGSTISDMIQEGSRDMKYSGNGISVKVIDENGSSQTRKVPWSDVGVTDKSTAYRWTYNVPAGDTGNKTYVITYTTEVNVSDYAAVAKLKNDATDKYGHTTGESEVGPEGENNKALIDKKVGDVTAETISWTVDITVPVQGLTTAKLIDTLPYNNAGHYDTLYGTVDDIVVENLGKNERAVKSYVDGTPKKVVINFQKFENGEWVDGLFGGDQTRRITVSLTTENNREWMERAETATYLREHTNAASFQANRQIITDQDTGTPMKSSFDKKEATDGNDKGPATVEIDGVTLPVYYYTILATGVTGPFTITDTFDSRFVLYEENPKYGVWGGDQYHQGYAGTELTPQTDLTQAGRIVFTITDNNLAKQPGGGYYSHYKINYALRVKDAAALDSLKKEAAQAVGGKLSLTNRAESPLGKDEATVTFENKTLTKELVNESDIGVSTNIGQFRIVVNPEGLDLDPDSETITLTDIYSDTLSIDYKTITVVPREGASWNVSAAGGQNTAVFTLPDETPIVITYSARVIGTGNIHFENTATVNGQEATISETKNVNAAMDGSAGNYGILLLKQKEGELSTTLSGAEFALYDKDKQPVLDKNNKPVTFTTTKEGAWIEGDQKEDGWTLKADTQYYLFEIKAPDGYVLPPESERTWYGFKIASDNIADYDQYIYHDGDTVKISNTPLGGIEVRKSVQGIELDDAQKNAITFTVTGSNGFTQTKKLSEFTDGSWKLTGLETGTYTVTETCGEIENYERTTSYSINKQPTVKGMTATVEVVDTTSETVVAYTNRYKSTVIVEPDKLQLKVLKKWFVGDEDSTSSAEFANETAEIHVKRYRAPAPVATLHFRGEDGTTNSFEADDVTVPKGAEVTLTIGVATNIRAMLVDGMSMWDRSASSIGGEQYGTQWNGTLPADTSDVYFCFQAKNPGSITVDYTGGSAPSEDAFTSDGTYDEQAVITGGGSKTFNNLPLSGKDGDTEYVYRYYVTETAKSGFSTQYQVGTGDFKDSISKTDAIGTEGNGTITVKNTRQSGSLKITKNVTVDREPTDTKFADGIYTFVVKGSDGFPVQGGKVDGFPLQDGKVSLTISGGQSTTVEVTDLPAGTYTIHEDTPENGTKLTSDNDVTVTVEAGKKGQDVPAAGIASFTNNAETTFIEVSKEWADDASKSTPVTFRVKRIGYYIDETQEDENLKKVPVEEEYYPEGARYTVTPPNKKKVTGLPQQEYKIVNGSGRIVHYVYSVVEDPVAQYRASYDDKNYTIINTPVQPAEHTTHLNVSKQWLNPDESDASAKHANDEITFKVIQNAIKADNIVPVTIQYSNRNSQAEVTEENIFVTKGTELIFDLRKPESSLAHTVQLIVENQTTHKKTTENYRLESNDTVAHPSVTVNAPMVIDVHLTFGVLGAYDYWGTQPRSHLFYLEWTHSRSVSKGKVYETYEELYNALKDQTPVPDAGTPYTMTRTSISTQVSPNPYTVVSDGNWGAKFTGLPQFQKVGEAGHEEYYIYTYEVAEVSVNGKPVTIDTSSGGKGYTDDYLVNWTGNNGNWTITNQEVKVGLNIVKADERDPAKKLKDAVFTLTELDVTQTGVHYRKDGATRQSEPTDTNGKTSFTNLKVGYYEVKESKAPEGYILASDSAFYIKVTSGEVTFLSRDDSKTPDKWSEAESSGLFEYVPKDGSKPATATVYNVPGAALPNTGGSGTGIFYLAGMLMISLCGVLLLRRRRCNI